MEVRQRTYNVKNEYANIHHCKFDLSRPVKMYKWFK